MKPFIKPWKNIVCFYTIIFVLSFFIQFFPQISLASNYYPIEVQKSFQKLQQIHKSPFAQSWKRLSLFPSSQLIQLKKQFTEQLSKLFPLDKNLECVKNNKNCFSKLESKYNQTRRQLFGFLHLEGYSEATYSINDIYCSRAFTNKDFPHHKNLGPNRIPLHTVLNAEHIWPQSRFSTKRSTETQKTDLHILYPSDSKTNSQRSNHLFGEVKKSTSKACGTAKIGFNQNKFEINFEPPNSHKGNVARAMFYFSVRYNLPISKQRQNMFKRWSQLDPVDDFERKRNEAIFKINKTRNPFIDHPESILYIYSSWGK